MTHEQMLEIAETIKSMLSRQFGCTAEVLEHEPGDGIPIAFTANDGDDDLVVELNVL